jgi:hypothetical protein
MPTIFHMAASCSDALISGSYIKDCMRKLWMSAFSGILSYFLHQIHSINNVKDILFCLYCQPFTNLAFSWKLVWDFYIPIIIFNQQMKVELFELTCFTTSPRHRIRQSRVWGLHLWTPMRRINIWQIMEPVENVVRVSIVCLHSAEHIFIHWPKVKSTVTWKEWKYDNILGEVTHNKGTVLSVGDLWSWWWYIHDSFYDIASSSEFIVLKGRM